METDGDWWRLMMQLEAVTQSRVVSGTWLAFSRGPIEARALQRPERRIMAPNLTQSHTGAQQKFHCFERHGCENGCISSGCREASAKAMWDHGLSGMDSSWRRWQVADEQVACESPMLLAQVVQTASNSRVSAPRFWPPGMSRQWDDGTSNAQMAGKVWGGCPQQHLWEHRLGNK